MTLLGRPADDVRRELIASYQSGLGLDRVAAKHGVTTTTVRYALRKFHVPIRSRTVAYARQFRIARQFFSLIRTAYEAGHSLEAIAGQYGVSAFSVRRALQMQGVSIRAKGTPFALSPEKRREAIEIAAKVGVTTAARQFGVHHASVIAWRKNPPTTTCDGCGNPATARFCDWCSLVA